MLVNYSDKINQSVEEGIDRLNTMVAEFDKRYHLNDLTYSDYITFINELEFGLMDIQDMHVYELSERRK